MTSQYVPGRGYTVRDNRGRVLGHSLTTAQRDALLSRHGIAVIPAGFVPYFAQ